MYVVYYQHIALTRTSGFIHKDGFFTIPEEYASTQKERVFRGTYFECVNIIKRNFGTAGFIKLFIYPIKLLDYY